MLLARNAGPIGLHSAALCGAQQPVGEPMRLCGGGCGTRETRLDLALDSHKCTKASGPESFADKE